jgi:azurin/glucose/arabinose dehydrogenase
MRPSTAAAGWTKVAMVVAVLATAPGGVAQGAPQEPNRGGEIDLATQDVQRALERIRPADGYEVSLFASEKDFPELANPLAMTFDYKGRLWVLTSPTYPHYFPGEEPDDKLVILEDRDGDGRADSLTVFADKLYVPMGFELGDGGAYVSQQPNLMFLRDTDGDGKADERRTILHGFGTEDSHHALSAFTWGPGGGLYFQEGTFLHTQVETPYGPVRVEEAAVFRYEPRTEKLSVFVSYPFANPWGHVIDRWGQNFISDASGGSNYFGTAFSGHVDYPRKQRPMKEWTLTKVRPTAGVELVSSRHFPESAQGNFLITNVIGFHGIKQYRVEEDGSGFVGIEVEPLLQSSDTNFRPVALQFGPDGALYVVDWFNPLIGHMQFSLRDPRRDRSHGRVWRVTAKGRPLLPKPQIDGQPIAKQISYLEAYEDRTRYWARLALRDQPTEAVVQGLRTWMAGLDPADPDYEHHLLEALWVFQHHDVVEASLLGRLLEAREFRARAAAVRVLQHWFDRVDSALELLEARVNDPAPRVRLEAVRALSFVPTVDAASVALEALRHPTDYYIQYALDSTITTLAPAWKPALAAGRDVAPGNPDGLRYLLARLEPTELTALPESEPVLRELLQRQGVPAGDRVRAARALAARSHRSPTDEIVAALRRIDGTPGSTAASGDLVRVLSETDATELRASRDALLALARTAGNGVTREGAWAALVRADGGVDQVWREAAATAQGRIDLIRAVPLIPDTAHREAIYPRLVETLDGLGTAEAGAATTPSGAAHAGDGVARGVRGRYVRVTAPGRDRTVLLAEVEILRDGANVAPKGKTSQSSLVSSGAVGGHPQNAVDGKLSSVQDGSNVPTGLAFTSQEADPWWEIDLGAEDRIDAIVVRLPGDPRPGSQGTLHVAVLDADRSAVFARDGLTTRVDTHTLEPGAPDEDALVAAAMLALTKVPGRERDAVARIARRLDEGRGQAGDAIAALRGVPLHAWPEDAIAPVARHVVTYAGGLPSEARTSAAFRDAVAFGRALADAAAPRDRDRLVADLEALTVRTVTITAVAAQMRFDVTQFTVVAGEDVEIVLVNADEMPHNLLVTAEGAMETVALQAEAMAATPDGFAKQFVPDSPLVLAATKLINPNETARLRLTAPTTPGAYPFVCTFPGHWRTMNGTMNVVRPAPATESR